MSKIPKLSPRFIKDLPITDDAKSQIKTRSQTKKDLIPNKENQTTAVAAKEEKKPKQLKNAIISNAALPSTSKVSEASSRTPIDRQRKVLNRSKTEPFIKLDHVFTERGGRITTSQNKQTVSLQSPAQATKKVEPPKGAVRLKQRLSFRVKKPSKFEELKREHPPIPSKSKSKFGDIPLPSKSKSSESAKVCTDQFSKNPKKNLRRSKTESDINLENINNKRTASKQFKPQIKQQVKNNGKEKDKIPQLPKPAILNIQEVALPDLQDIVPESLKFQTKFVSPQEAPHSGLQFFGKRKKSMILKLNLSPSTSQTTTET